MLGGSLAEQVEAARWGSRCGAVADDLVPDLVALQSSANEYGRVHAACALAAISRDSLVDRSVLTSEIEAGRHIDLVLCACGSASAVAADVAHALYHIANDDERTTWPKAYDAAIVDDERFRDAARRILG